MNRTPQVPNSSHTWVDHIPVIWCEPEPQTSQTSTRLLTLYIPPFSSTKEACLSSLQELAQAGVVALSFDPWQHGERGTESRKELQTRVFSNFRRHMWPILGQTTLDVLRIIDWATETLGVEPRVSVAGLSMGGDIAVAAAGLDHRIERVAAIIATPDWLRPGMQDISRPGVLLPPGTPDAYARYFYDLLNPLTHLAAFAHSPSIHFICGAQDTHVPPDGALRFQKALQDAYPSVAGHVQVSLLAGRGHLDFRDPDPWWPNCLAWLTSTKSQP